jgi:hypothetical protein
MKRIIASVGFAALGVSTLHAQYAPGVTPAEMANPRGWAVGATVREFYDDNYLTLPNSAARSSYGEEVSPSAALNGVFNNTTLTTSYVFDLKHYESTDLTDSSHQFNAQVLQRFSDRYNLQIGESFVIAQEPTVLNNSSAFVATPLRASGANVHNTGMIKVTAGLTPTLDLQVSYNNDVYAYQQTFGDVFNPGALPPSYIPMSLNPSYSALLDRMEQQATVNLNWKMMNELTGVAGYTYGHTGFTSPEPIIFAGPPGQQNFGNPANIFSQDRNSDSHFLFVGGDWQINSQLTGRVRVGGEYVDYYNADTDALSPYVDASLTWLYMKGSTVQGGVTHEHSTTDVVGALPATTGPNAGQPVLDADSTVAYLSVNQTIGNLTGSLLGQYQHSAFNGGSENGQSEDFFVTGLNMAYRFDANFRAETGYNWNKLVSDVSGRDYTRNTVYVGVRATY